MVSYACSPAGYFYAVLRNPCASFLMRIAPAPHANLVLAPILRLLYRTRKSNCQVLRFSIEPLIPLQESINTNKNPTKQRALWRQPSSQQTPSASAHERRQAPLCSPDRGTLANPPPPPIPLLNSLPTPLLNPLRFQHFTKTFGELLHAKHFQMIHFLPTDQHLKLLEETNDRSTYAL